MEKRKEKLGKEGEEARKIVDNMGKKVNNKAGSRAKRKRN